MKYSLLLLLFLSSFTFAETPVPPKTIVEQNGKVTNVSAEGNLASYQKVGCIPLSEAKNTFTPADMHKGIGECIAQGNYDFAVNLLMLADMYGLFDAARVTDKTAGQAIIALRTNTFANVPQDKKTKLSELINHLASDTELRGKLCGEIDKLGPPDYYPSYMILHGVKAFTGNPHEGALVKDFDALGVWKKLQSASLKCAETSVHPKIISDQNGKVTDVSVGCIPLAEAKNTFTPPYLLKRVEDCIAQGNYDFAVGLFSLAEIYASFDAERITNNTAGQAKNALTTNVLLNLPREQRTSISRAFTRLSKSTELRAKACGDVQKIGPPDYYPNYRILNEVKTSADNPHVELVKDFDTPRVWKNIYSGYLQCPT